MQALDWDAVPAAVVERLRTLMPYCKRAAAAFEAAPVPLTGVWLNDSVLGVVADDPAAAAKYCIKLGAELIPEPVGELVFRPHPYRNLLKAANPISAAPPLVTSLVGGLAGGLGAYGTGAVMEHLFPEKYVERGKLRKRLGWAGAALGAIPGLWLGSAASRAATENGNPTGFFEGLLTAPDALSMPAIPAKAAAATGIADLDSIPVDAFNQAVWNDVRRGGARNNIYGTKNPWGDDSQPLHTPPAVGAAATGLVAGIGEMANSSFISPLDIVRGLAGAGVGLGTAYATGRVLGALGGLTPPAQEKLQQAGLWGGLLTAAIRPLFR